jgi:uncharacterized caspase-like protein
MTIRSRLLCLTCVGALGLGLALGASAAGKRYALLVGVKVYRHSDLSDLEFTERDVEQLAEILRHGGYQVTLLTTAAGEKDKSLKPTLANIRKALKDALKDVGKADTVLVAMAGHGVQPTGAKESYFCPTDGNLNTPETLLPLAGLIEELTKIGAGVKLLLVDACRDDPDARRHIRGINADSAMRLVTASQARQEENR